MNTIRHLQSNDRAVKMETFHETDAIIKESKSIKFQTN